jgi:hypothetical protein
MMKKEKYNEIMDFIRNYPGLAIDCEKDLKEKFQEIDPHTLGSILGRFGQNRIKGNYYRLAQRATQFLQQ